jgi:hypothetical protein
MKTLDEQKAEHEERRSNPLKSAARYDEIMHLRMFLLNINHQLYRSQEPEALTLRREIMKLAIQWGKKGDCV